MIYSVEEEKKRVADIRNQFAIKSELRNELLEEARKRSENYFLKNLIRSNDMFEFEASKFLDILDDYMQKMEAYLESENR